MGDMYGEMNAPVPSYEKNDGAGYAGSKTDSSPYAAKMANAPESGDGNGPKAQVSPLAGKYRVIDGNLVTCTTVRGELGAAAEAFAARNELTWAFPYVYALVTNEMLQQQSAFKYTGTVLRWISNFYELYALNLNIWLGGGQAEEPWQTAFTQPNTLRTDQPWGARSLAAFILGMYAHIKSDLPRAIAYVYIKFYFGRTAEDGSNYELRQFKVDYDRMNDAIFPKVMESIVQGKTQIIPSLTAVLPDSWRAGLLQWYADRSGLEAERENAWIVAEAYAAAPEIQKNVIDGMSITSAITRIQRKAG